MNTERIQLSDAELDVHLRGDGPSVVLLQHFRLNSVEHYEPLVQRLVEAGFRAVIVDQRGVGNSTGSLDGLTLHDLAADIASVIEALDIAPAHVVGHAFDNRIARCLATDRPDLVKSLILLAAGWSAGPTPEGQAAFGEMLRPDASEDERLAAVRAGIYAEEHRHLASVHDWEGVTVFTAALTAANAATPLEDWWAGGEAPILVIQGLDDVVAPPENGRDLKDKLADRVTLVELASAGHVLLPEQPDAVSDAILTFLRE